MVDGVARSVDLIRLRDGLGVAEIGLGFNETLSQASGAGVGRACRGMRTGPYGFAQVDHAASIINGQGRRNIDGQSPTELYNALTVH